MYLTSLEIKEYDCLLPISWSILVNLFLGLEKMRAVNCFNKVFFFFFWEKIKFSS